MGHIKSFIYEFKNTYTRDDQIITILFSSLFLPFQMSGLLFCLGFIYIVWKGHIKAIIKKVKGSKVIIVLALYLFVVSIVSQNWLGAGLSVLLLIYFICILHYRFYVHRKLFEQVLDILVILSIVACVYAVIEQFYYMTLVEGMGYLDIQNKPELRVHTFFMNANYYAMMLVFIENVCVYKFMKFKKISFRLYYTLIGVINLFALYLTGGRTAWLCLALSVLLMLIVSKWYKTLALATTAIGGSLFVLSLKPDLLPRLVTQGLDVARRTQIWNTAQLMIPDIFLFGRGPLAYMHLYPSYTQEYIDTYGLASYEEYKLGISAPHSHTILFEGLISFGLIGTILLAIYTICQLRCFIKIMAYKVDPIFCGLVMGVFMTTISFCIIDFPILWIQTGTFLFFILGTCDIFNNEVKL